MVKTNSLIFLVLLILVISCGRETKITPTPQTSLNITDVYSKELSFSSDKVFDNLIINLDDFDSLSANISFSQVIIPFNKKSTDLFVVLPVNSSFLNSGLNIGKVAGTGCKIDAKSKKTCGTVLFNVFFNVTKESACSLGEGIKCLDGGLAECIKSQDGVNRLNKTFQCGAGCLNGKCNTVLLNLNVNLSSQINISKSEDYLLNLNGDLVTLKLNSVLNGFTLNISGQILSLSPDIKTIILLGKNYSFKLLSSSKNEVEVSVSLLGVVDNEFSKYAENVVGGNFVGAITTGKDSLMMVGGIPVNLSLNAVGSQEGMRNFVILYLNSEKHFFRQGDTNYVNISNQRLSLVVNNIFFFGTTGAGRAEITLSPLKLKSYLFSVPYVMDTASFFKMQIQSAGCSSVKAKNSLTSQQYFAYLDGYWQRGDQFDLIPGQGYIAHCVSQPKFSPEQEVLTITSIPIYGEIYVGVTKMMVGKPLGNFLNCKSPMVYNLAPNGTFIDLPLNTPLEYSMGYIVYCSKPGLWLLNRTIT